MTKLQAGELFANRFEIDRIAGSGGMGTVYRARDRYSGEPVALKLLNAQPGHPRDPHEVQRFEREAQLLSELRHPGIVSHVAHGQTPDGQRYLAMEWLEGEDLAQRLARGPLAMLDALRLLRGVAEALTAAHRCGVVHRDLKPSNLFLPDRDLQRVKLLDFGIARRQVVSTAMTRTGLLVGTPEYMAPEQARGAREVTPAADIFSLGCVLYECLTGTSPFAADHVAAILVRILFEEPAPLPVRRPGLPESVTALVRQMLCKEVDQRIGDAAQLLRQLAEVGEVPELATLPTLAASAAAPSAFGENEQALFSLVVAAASGTPGTEKKLDGERRAGLLSAVRALGARAEFLLDGALVATLPQTGSATDQAAMAARVALLVKERWPQAGVAVSTGRGMVQGPLAVGEVADRAAQLLAKEQTGAPGSAADSHSGVWLDELSARLIGAPFVLLRSAEGMLLLGEEKQADDSRPLLGRPTPCVGRDVELAMLEGRLHGCVEDAEAQAIVITAPPGVGKSRLRHEFLRRVERRSEPITVLLGRGELLSAGAAYGIFGRALCRLCGLSGGEPVELARERLRQRIGMHLSPLDQPRVTAFIGELCGVPFSEQDPPFLREARQDPKTLPQRLRRAALDWLVAECQAAPVLVVLDDLHWGDELSVALLDEALRELRNAPLFVLGLGRPELHTAFPRLWQGHSLQEIALKGLSKRACDHLIQQVLGKQASPEAVSWMVEQSAGNALFLEELIRAVADGKTGSGSETVIAMLQARIGRLPAGPRRAVLAASIYGQSFGQAGVARIIGLLDPAPEVAQWLQTLCENEIIEAHGSSRIPEQRQYGFRHALVRDAAYALLSAGDQQLGHKLAAEFLEATDKQVAHALLAYHFRRAGLLDQALAHYCRAGERASQQGLHAEACLHYAAADETIGSLPRIPPLLRLHVTILLKQVNSGMTFLSAESQSELLKRARERLDALSALAVTEREDRLLAARVDFYQARIYLYGGQSERAIPFFQRVLPIAREFADEELLALTCLVVSMAEITIGQIAQGVETMAPLLGPAGQSFGMSLDAIRCLMYPALAYSANGRFREAAALTTKAHALAIKSQQPASRGLVFMLEAMSRLWAAEWSEAIQAGQEALSLARQTGQTIQAYSALDAIAYAQSQTGVHEPALKARAQAVALRKTLGHTIGEDWFDAREAELLLNAGRNQEALAQATRMAQTTKEAGLLMAYAIAQRAWGGALARLGWELAEAEAHLQESLSLCEQTGAVGEVIQTHTFWGRIRRERGDEAAARVHFDRARALLEAGGSDKGLEWLRDVIGGQSA